MTTARIAAMIALFAASPACAYDGIVTGVLGEMETGDAVGLWVNLVGRPALCGNANSWTYLPLSNPNYQVAVSLLVTAHATGRQVTLYSSRDGSGVCQMGYMHLS